jgi:hypothetical protein
MTIVVLGWGSLCWDPRDLPIIGSWHADGPLLPVEFARVSKDRRLTLVLRKRTKRVKVLWAEMNTATIDKAIDGLKIREETPNKDNLGWVDLHNPLNNNCKTFRTALTVTKRWARRKHLDAVVWTDLPSNFREKTGMDFTEDNVVAYLQSLDRGESQKAEEYVRKAPRQIKTKMRDVFEERLGWRHRGEGL